MRKIVTATAVAAIALGVGMPAAAQETNGPTNTTINSTMDDDNVIVNDLLDLVATDNSADQDNDGNGSYNGNSLSFIAATQTLSAVNTNSEMDELVDLDGEDESDTPVGYNSGNNVVRDNAFAAFAGINNAAWNTGINANTQAATNIAAQGTVNFGVGGSSAADGGAGGGED
ncbi:hypothetical protein [Qipengyuania spongiae]|uniref:Secreted protein n=1 Tax=Qipengyuania spongiae TaxID=2909673 RepID=A0ABY5SYH4_9SPHN|nr:hypothetical protein [Qipengyuania spongiae]UVI39577.1 hypothetical protein L1F33_01015 [Qipengyuania spongiae]